MSGISNQFRRFYFGVVLEQAFDAVKSVGEVYFPEWMDTNTGGILKFIYGVDFFDKEELRTIFKFMDLNYPVDGEGKVSNRNISVRELLDHIEWIIKTLGMNGLELEFVAEEWQRILDEAREMGY